MRKNLLKILASRRSDRVLAAVDGKSSSYVLALHHCQNKACQASYVVNRMAAPLCVCCTTPMKIDADKKRTRLTADEIVNDSEMTQVADCEDCGSSMYAMKELASEISGRTGHCVTCGEEVVFSDDMGDDAAGDGEMAPAAEEFDFGDEEPVEQIEGEGDDSGWNEFSDEDGMEDAGSMDGMDGMGDMDPADDTGDIVDDMPEEMAAEPAPQISSEPPVATPAPAPAVPDAAPAPAAEMVTDDPTEMDDENVGPLDEEPAVTAGLKKGRRAITANTLTWVQANMKKVKEIDLAVCGGTNPRWYFFANHKPFAIATVDKVSDRLRPFFASQKFAELFQQAASDGLTDQVVQDFGMEPVQTEIPVTDAVQQNVDTAVQQATQEMTEKTEMAASLYDACVGIAALGSIKKVLPIENPLLTAMAAEFKRLGDPNAEVTAANIMQKAGPDYFKKITAHARDLTKKSKVQLNEISGLVEASAFLAAAPVAAKPTTTIRPSMIPNDIPGGQPVVASASGDNITDIRTLIGRAARRINRSA